MSRAGNCYEKAVAESFLATLTMNKHIVISIYVVLKLNILCFVVLEGL